MWKLFLEWQRQVSWREAKACAEATGRLLRLAEKLLELFLPKCATKLGMCLKENYSNSPSNEYSRHHSASLSPSIHDAEYRGTFLVPLSVQSALFKKCTVFGTVVTF